MCGLGGSLRDSIEGGPRAGWEGNLRQPVLRWRELSLLVVLLCSLHCNRAPGQVVPSIRLPLQTAVFGTFTYIKPTLWVAGDNAVWGFAGGSYVQTPNVFGFELRGTVSTSSGQLQQEGARAGPRAVWRYGPFSTYTAVLAGITNSWEWRLPGLRPRFGLRERASPDLTILGGVDFHMAHHISLRLGEVSYSRIHRRDVDLNTFGVSVGAVYRLPPPHSRGTQSK
jgi:hypothetical protein